MTGKEKPQGGPPLLEENSGFYQRWSRLKREVDQSQSADAVAAGSAPDPTPAPLRDEDMPSLDALTPESDYSGFLSPEVSGGLRRLALRKLFHGADFNLCDGLDDYDDDFTGFEKLVGIVTADMKHRIEQEARQLAEPNPAPETNSGKPLPAITSSDEGEGDSERDHPAQVPEVTVVSGLPRGNEDEVNG